MPEKKVMRFGRSQRVTIGVTIRFGGLSRANVAMRTR